MTDEPHDARRQTAIGAFVLGGVVLVLAAIMLFGKVNVFSPTQRAAVVFQDSISGLSVGAPVTFRGVRVGAVESLAVQFDSSTKVAYIPVTVKLESTRVTLNTENGGSTLDLPQLIARGLRAEINVQSFVTGQSEIALEFDPASDPALHPNITSLLEIPARQSTIQKVRDQLSQLPLRELADDANATLRSLRGVSEKLDQSLPPLIDSLRTTSEGVAAAVATASQAITGVQARLDKTLGDIDHLAATGSQFLTQRGTELHTVLLSSNQAVVQARDLLADLKSLTSERGADRANFDSTLRDLATAAAALRGLAHDVERNPQLLLTGRRP